VYLDGSYKETIGLAKHYKAIGQTKIYISSDSAEKPWHLVTGCEPGGSHRLDINTSVRFTAVDPDTGLEFNWSFDIEPHEANGTGSYQIDAKACMDVLAKLPKIAAKQFKAYLAECATKVAERGDEYFKLYRRQHADADTLRKLSGE
jgi:hypothetical protein